MTASSPRCAQSGLRSRHASCAYFARVAASYARFSSTLPSTENPPAPARPLELLLLASPPAPAVAVICSAAARRAFQSATRGSTSSSCVANSSSAILLDDVAAPVPTTTPPALTLPALHAGDGCSPTLADDAAFGD